MALIKCPECEKEISDKAKSCPHCGCPLNEDNSMSSYIDENSIVKSEPKKPDKKIIIIVLAVILAIAVGIIIFLITKPDDSDSKKTLNTVDTTATTTVTTTVTTTTTTTAATTTTKPIAFFNRKNRRAPVNSYVEQDAIDYTMLHMTENLNAIFPDGNFEFQYDEDSESYILSMWGKDFSTIALDESKTKWNKYKKELSPILEAIDYIIAEYDPYHDTTYCILNEKNKDDFLLKVYNGNIVYDVSEK